MKLSILICSTMTRFSTFLPKMLNELSQQLSILQEEDRRQVEIITLIDNQSMTVGNKRNHLISASKGEYVVFVDDDDRLSSNYITRLLEAVESQADVLTFIVSVSINRAAPKPCYYSMHYEKDHNQPDAYFRLPNHIMCIRRSLIVQVPFQDISFGEDADFAKRIKPLFKTEYQIAETLYHYDFNQSTSETQFAPKKRENANNGICDVVILSNANTEALVKMTQKAIDSLVASEKTNVFNIIVIEQTQHSFNNARTIYMPGKFNYNQFANIGIKEGSASWICVANNDLIFEPGWFHQMVKLDYQVMSPKNPGDRRQADIVSPKAGRNNGRHFSGWCFVMKRSIYDRIGQLDEDFPFWYADDATIQQLKAIGVTPILVPQSIVRHLASITLKTLDEQLKNELTIKQIRKFNRKYNQNLFNRGQ